ncbi:MAG TPA: glycosyltransferase family 87 protein [Vicinamibacterales bacterium]|nr:glycosyltransferase family 87 protein [Vicinamibacterales bacterium]
MSRRSFWHVTVREATAHAVILAAVLWIGAALLIVSGRDGRDAFGNLKGADFVHFYTLGRLALERRADLLFDGPRQHEAQVAYVPASEPDGFVPVYPPHAALWFAPFATLGYVPAAFAWAIVTALAYAFAVGVAWRAGGAREWGGPLVVAAAAAFPPFWNLVLHGQTTAIPLIAFAGGYLALARDQRVLAGAVLALASVKPQLGVVLAVVVLATGDWRLMLGAAVSLAIQAAAVGLWFGQETLWRYVDVVRQIGDVRDLLEPKPYQLHSIRTLADLMPQPWSTLFWYGALAAIALLVIRIWRSHAPLPVRFGALVIATLLASPHLTVYDVTLAAPALLWLAPVSVAAIYLLYVTTLVPTALFLPIQISVLVLLAIFLTATRVGRAPTDRPQTP